MYIHVWRTKQNHRQHWKRTTKHIDRDLLTTPKSDSHPRTQVLLHICCFPSFFFVVEGGSIVAVGGTIVYLARVHGSFGLCCPTVCEWLAAWSRVSGNWTWCPVCLSRLVMPIHRMVKLNFHRRHKNIYLYINVCVCVCTYLY